MVGKYKFFRIIFFVITITSMLFGSVTTTIEEPTLEKPTLFNKNEMSNLSSIRQDKGESLGEENTFWVVDPNTGDYEQVTAKLLSIGQYCYIYVDLTTITALGETEATERSDSYSTEFDSIMYPTNLELVGHPDGFIGDVDGDPKITVLFTSESYGGVYFFKDDDPTHPYSNIREMVYIHSDKGELDGYNTLIHELNHLIWFNHEQDEAIFVLEGTAEYSRYKAGYLNNASYISALVAADYNLTYQTNYFKGHPETSLLYWDYDNNILNRASYGRSYMFMLYLSERFGEGFLTDLVTITEDGPAGIEKALRNRGLNQTFNEIFLDWITACTVDMDSFDDGKYGYQTADFKISSLTEITQLPYLSAERKYHLYGFDVRRMNSPPNEFTVKITNPKPHVVGISAIINDENGWNITQVICPDNDEEELYLYFSGEDIESAYIITSIISSDIPYAPSFLYPRLTAPYKYLTLTILDGHVVVEVSENANLRILYTGLSIIISSIIINQKRKSKR